MGSGLERLGLAPGEPIAVDANLCAPVPGGWLYAVSDCNGVSLLTHEGKYQARIAADHLLGRPGSSVLLDGRLSPRVIFTEPQIAAVGHTLATALKPDFGACREGRHRVPQAVDRHLGDDRDRRGV